MTGHGMIDHEMEYVYAERESLKRENAALNAERDVLLAEKRTFWKDDGELRAEVERLRAEEKLAEIQAEKLRDALLEVERLRALLREALNFPTHDIVAEDDLCKRIRAALGEGE